MPRPITQGRSDVYAQHLAQGRELGERNDCSVRAVAAATGRDYAEVHALFKAEGRRDAKATPIDITWAVLRQLGYIRSYVPAAEFIRKYPGAHKGLKSVTTHHPDRFSAAWADGNTYLVFTPGHVLAVVNGVNHDWTRGRALRATAIYRVVPA